MKDTMFFSRGLCKPRHGQRPVSKQRQRKTRRDNRVKNSAGQGLEGVANAAHADADSEALEQGVLTKGKPKSLQNLRGVEEAGGIRLDKLLMR